MVKRLRILLYIAMSLSDVAAAREASVKQAMQQKHPGLQVESVVKTPLAGIYEVFAGGEIVYVDENVDHVIVRGRLIDGARRADLTDERIRVLTGVTFDQLPFDLAFRIVKGNGKLKVAYFTDPNCPACRRLDHELAKVTDVTVHVFLYPILSQDSYQKAKAVWCSEDRGKVYIEMMFKGIPPKTAAACDTPIEKIVAYGRQKNVGGTPTLFFAGGERVTGAIPADQLEKLLDGAR